MNDVINLLESVASYMEKRDESPLCAYDLRQIIPLLDVLQKIADRYYEYGTYESDIAYHAIKNIRLCGDKK